MAIIVKLKEKNPSEIMEIVREMREQGMIQGKDFDFAYHPDTWDNFSHVIEKHTVFTFYNEKYGTWFKIKWS